MAISATPSGAALAASPPDGVRTRSTASLARVGRKPSWRVPAVCHVGLTRSAEEFRLLDVDGQDVSRKGGRERFTAPHPREAYSTDHAADVDGYGLVDLICQILTAEFVIETGASAAALDAQTLDGSFLRGEEVRRVGLDSIAARDLPWANVDAVLSPGGQPVAPCPSPHV